MESKTTGVGEVPKVPRIAGSRCRRRGHKLSERESEWLVSVESLNRLLEDVNRLTPMVSELSDSELQRWCQIAMRFQDERVDDAEILTRRDSIVYLASAMGMNA